MRSPFEAPTVREPGQMRDPGQRRTPMYVRNREVAVLAARRALRVAPTELVARRQFTPRAPGGDGAVVDARRTLLLSSPPSTGRCERHVNPP
jgi:hypothetical protein